MMSNYNQELKTDYVQQIRSNHQSYTFHLTYFLQKLFEQGQFLVKSGAEKCWMMIFLFVFSSWIFFSICRLIICPPLTETISPLRIGFLANKPRPSVSLILISVFTERDDEAFLLVTFVLFLVFIFF